MAELRVIHADGEPMEPPRRRNVEIFSAPWLLGTAFLVFATAILEKVLNLVGLNIPVLNVFPRQLLEWSVTLAIFEIALTLRQLHELARRRPPPVDG